MAEEEGRGFLSRWSQKKRAAEKGVSDEVEAEPFAEELELEAQSLAEDTSAEDDEARENREAAEAVDIEALGYNDDFTIFLKRGVPDLLKRRALQQLWRSNPVLANLDGLNDYDEDFRNPAHNVYKSLWQAGRGFLSKAEQQLQYDTGRLTEEEPEEIAAISDEPVSEVVASDETIDAIDAEPPEDNADALIDTDIETVQTEDEAPARVSIRQRLIEMG